MLSSEHSDRTPYPVWGKVCNSLSMGLYVVQRHTLQRGVAGASARYTACAIIVQMLLEPPTSDLP